MQKKSERHFCLLVLGAFKNLPGRVPRDEGGCRTPGQGRKEQRGGKAEPGQRTQTSGAFTQAYPELPCITRGTTNASTKEREVFFGKAQTWEEAKNKERKGCVSCRRQTENSDIHKA